MSDNRNAEQAAGKTVLELLVDDAQDEGPIGCACAFAIGVMAVSGLLLIVGALFVLLHSAGVPL